MAEEEQEKQTVKETLKEAIQNVQSPAEAERVLDQLETAADDVTEAEAASSVQASSADPIAALAEATRDAPPAQETAVALTAVAAESVAPNEKAVTTLEATQELLLPESRGERPPADLVKPRGYLQEAVLRRMSPLQAWDAWLFIAVNHLPHSRLSNSLMYALTIVMTGGVAWQLATLWSWLRGAKDGRRAVREMAVCVTISTWIVEYPIKAYFRRKRPFIAIVRALVIGKKPGSWSFPSGHTASSFASARILSTIWPQYRAAYYALAGLVGFSRTYLGAHYPGDVLSGAFSGTVIAELTRRILNLVLARRARRLR